MSVDANQFKNGLKLWASGVSVVTTKTHQNLLKGMTATSFCSVSVDPPQILVCLNQVTDTGAALMESRNFAVNILAGDQQDVSNLFSGTNTQAQRFVNASWEPGESGVPLLTGALAALECTVVQQIQAGTHWIVVGEVQNVVCRSGEPLLYYNGAYRQLADV